MKDTLTLGTVAGIIGTIVMHIFSTVFSALNLITVTTVDYAGALFLVPDQLNTIAGIIVAHISHLMVGIAGGVLLAYFMKMAGKDFYWLKGLALAGFMLLGGMGFILHIMELVPHLMEDSVTVLLHFVNYGAYGLTTAFIIARYGHF